MKQSGLAHLQLITHAQPTIQPHPHGLRHSDCPEPNWICPCKHLGGPLSWWIRSNGWIFGGSMVANPKDGPMDGLTGPYWWRDVNGQTFTTLGWFFKNPKLSLLGYYQGNQQLVPSHVAWRETSCKKRPLDKLALYTPDKSSRKHLIPKCFTGGVPLGKLQDDSLRRRGFNPHLSVEWNYVRYIFTYFCTWICILYTYVTCMYINNVVYIYIYVKLRNIVMYSLELIVVTSSYLWLYKWKGAPVLTGRTNGDQVLWSCRASVFEIPTWANQLKNSTLNKAQQHSIWNALKKKHAG